MEVGELDAGIDNDGKQAGVSISVRTLLKLEKDYMSVAKREASGMTAPRNPYTDRTGYIYAAQGENGWFCVFDKKSERSIWRMETHQWLVMKMPSGTETTTRTREEAVRLAKASANATDIAGHWWK